MARNEITFQVNLKKDTNSASRTYGMYFGEAESKEPLNLKPTPCPSRMGGVFIYSSSKGFPDPFSPP